MFYTRFGIRLIIWESKFQVPLGDVDVEVAILLHVKSSLPYEVYFCQRHHVRLVLCFTLVVEYQEIKGFNSGESSPNMVSAFLEKRKT